jgi:hypothetical protein
MYYCVRETQSSAPYLKICRPGKILGSADRGPIAIMEQSSAAFLVVMGSDERRNDMALILFIIIVSVLFP